MIFIFDVKTLLVAMLLS